MPIKRDFEDSNTPGLAFVFNGDTSSWPAIRARRGRDTAVTKGWIFLFKEFFEQRFSNRRINLLRSQAIVLIHEAIHVQRFSDDNFGGSDGLDTFIIKSCINKKWGHNDMSL
jgi:hypothetical protein